MEEDLACMHGLTPSSDECDKICDKTDPDYEKKIQDCYCVCWKKFPRTPRGKSAEELIKEWKAQNPGEVWPRGALAHHILALADGGADAGFNIFPLVPGMHKEYHQFEKDANRWGKRRGRTCKE